LLVSQLRLVTGSRICAGCSTTVWLQGSGQPAPPSKAALGNAECAAPSWWQKTTNRHSHLGVWKSSQPAGQLRPCRRSSPRRARHPGPIPAHGSNAGLAGAHRTHARHCALSKVHGGDTPVPAVAPGEPLATRPASSAAPPCHQSCACKSPNGESQLLQRQPGCPYALHICKRESSQEEARGYQHNGQQVTKMSAVAAQAGQSALLTQSASRGTASTC
jgi:hypothetical protein